MSQVCHVMRQFFVDAPSFVVNFDCQKVIRTLACHLSIERSLQALFVEFPSDWDVSAAREVIVYQRKLSRLEFFVTLGCISTTLKLVCTRRK